MVKVRQLWVARGVGGVFVLVGLLLLGGVVDAASRLRIERPNVVLITAEALGIGDLGVNGQAYFETPRLDAFAAGGIRFTNYYAGGCSGVVSRASMLTGRHTGHALIRGDGDLLLTAADVSLGELAKRAGYRTGAIGKWGFGGVGSSGAPAAKGFDEWFGYLTELEATNHYPAVLWRNGAKVFWKENAGGERRAFAPYLFTGAATNFIRVNRRRSFFLYLAYALPSAPLQSPTDKPYEKEDWPVAQRTLGAMIYRLDREVGRVLDALSEHGVDGKTIVFFAGAVGPHAAGGVDPRFFNSTGGLRGHQGDLYEGGLRVPLLVRWPGRIEGGRVSGHLCAAWDLYPSVGHLMGLDGFDVGDGISLVAELLGRRQRDHSFFYWERFGEGGLVQAVRSGNWKALRMGVDGAVSLFHLGRDPWERDDLAGRYRRVTRRMEGYLEAARMPLVDWSGAVDSSGGD